MRCVSLFLPSLSLFFPLSRLTISSPSVVHLSSHSSLSPEWYIQECGNEDQEYGTSNFIIITMQPGTWKRRGKKKVEREREREGLKSIRTLIHHTTRRGGREEDWRASRKAAEKAPQNPKYEDFSLLTLFPLLSSPSFLYLLFFNISLTPLQRRPKASFVWPMQWIPVLQASCRRYCITSHLLFLTH